MLDWVKKTASSIMTGVRDGLSKLKTAAEATAPKVAQVIKDNYQKALAPIVAAVPASFEAAETIATKIPSAFLSAFGEAGAPAASTLSTLASYTALPLALAGTGYEAYKAYQSYKDLQAARTEYDKAFDQWQKGIATSTEEYKAKIQQLTDIKKKYGIVEAPAPTPSVVVTPTPMPVITPTPTPAPVVTPTPAPTVIERIVEKPGAAPNVYVNIPPIPQPLQVTAPLTATELAGIAPFLATTFAQAGHQTTRGCMETTGAALLANILRALLPSAIAAGFMFSPTLQQAITSVATKFVEAIYSPLTGQAPITPEKAPGIGATLLGQAVMFGSGAHIMSILAEASAPLKHMGVGYLAAFMADAAGFSRIAAAYQGMMIQIGLQDPMRYWAHAHFRPELPSASQLLNLVGEYAISREEFDRTMPYHGFDNYWINRLFELADRPFSPMLFRFLANAGELPEELLDRELKNASYNALSIPTLKKAFTRLAAGELAGQFMSSVKNAHSKGLLTPAEFGDHTDNLGYSEVQVKRALYAAELDFAVALAEEFRAVYLKQHSQGQINDGELAVQLSSVGYRPEKVSADVAKARAWFKPKPEPKVDPKIEAAWRAIQAKYIQGYLDLYSRGYLDDQGLYDALLGVKVEPELAKATVFMASTKTLPKLAA